MSLFTYIKNQLPILDVVSESVSLKPAGHYWKGSCPFHSEKDASFTVSPDKQIYYCFGCHESGDVISFIAKRENLSQLQAAYHLIEQYDLEVPKELLKGNLPSPQEKSEKERYFLLCKAVSNWAHKQLTSRSKAYSYVTKRQIIPKLIKTFQLGYFPSGTNAINRLIKALGQDGFLVKDLIDYGILIEGKATHYSPFEERILFPIRDTLGRSCGFGGRTFKQGDQRPKYYNSKESDGFEKGKLLFGFHEAKKSLKKEETAFLVEGYMDCIAMVQHGYTNTIATLGTACTLGHLKLLSRFIHTLFVLYDGDQAGQKAILRLTDLCWDVSLDLKVVTLPEGQDPDSFLTSKGNLTALINQAVDIITFFINSAGSNFAAKPLAKKLSAAEKITSLIAKVSDTLKRDILLHQAASITQLPFSTLKNLAFKVSIRHKKQTENKKSIVCKNSGQNPDPQDTQSTLPKELFLLEEKIFSAILNNIRIFNPDCIPKDIRQYFSPNMQHLFEKLRLFACKKNDRKNSAHHFFDTLEGQTKQWAIRTSMAHGVYECKQTLDHLLIRFCKYHWQRIVRDIKEEIKKAKLEQNTDKVNEILKRFTLFKQKMLYRGPIE